MTTPWIRTHAPKRGSDVVGHEDAIARIRAFIEAYRPGQKPLLLHGPPGTGKTSAVHALALELDREIIELNASDARNKESINALLGAALRQRSLFAKGKVILIDEADGLSGNSDRGGVQALLALIEDAPYPILITANDAENEKLKPLKKASTTVEFPPLASVDLLSLLHRVAHHEGLACDEQALSAIAHRTGGDARAAINDLQSMSDGKRFTVADLDALGDRERNETIQQALLRVFKTTSAATALPAYEHVDEDIDKLFLWIDENLPKEYTKPADLARAYDALAEADKHFGRIRRWQHYRFYVYIYDLLSAGIALAKETKYPGVREYQRSSRPLTMWIANQKQAKRKAVAQKLGTKTHTSAKRSLGEVGLFKPIFERDKKAAARIAAALDLTTEEAAWLAG